MPAAEGAYLGLAKQHAYGEITDDGDPIDHSAFDYILFKEGAIAPNNIVIPLDPEVGGGALLRQMVKVGVNSGGAMSFIPRPDTLGHFLYGITGKVTSTADALNTNSDFKEGVCGPVTLLTSAQTGWTTRIHQPETATAVYVYSTDATDLTAVGSIVTIYGTVGGSADHEDITLNGTTKVAGSKLFTAISSIDFPVRHVANEQVSIGIDGGYTQHVFELSDDQFDAPYYVLREAIPDSEGTLWGQQLQDCRVNVLALEWRAANFINGTAGFIGGLPAIADPSGWECDHQVDNSPVFISPYGEIELPTGTAASVLAGAFQAQAAIPLDEQMVVGSFTPELMSIVQRSFAVSLTVKVNDNDLYKKMTYDPAGGNAWAASMFKEARMKLKFRTAVGQYMFQIEANGSASDPNVYWSAAPIGLRAQRQVIMQVTGMFTGTSTGTPITITLNNKKATY